VTIVDFHNHYYPEIYLRELEAGRSRLRLEKDGVGQLLLHYPGDYNVVVAGHRDLDERIRVMDSESVDVQAISLTTPGVHVEERGRGIALASLVNDAFAEAAGRHPGRFAPLAALPLQDPAASVREAERALTTLGHRGVLLFSHVNGRGLDDEVFLPLFEALEGLGAPVFIHPTSPRALEGIQEYRLAAILGFLFDTTVAAARLIFAGVLERFPRLTVVLGHLGGTLPYVVERMDRGFHAYPECRTEIRKPPSEYFSKMYVDTVNFERHALTMALSKLGADRLVLGTDFPHQVGNVGGAIAAVRGLKLPADDERKILGGTAARLLGLPSQPDVTGAAA
jgi:aminocarboxymuconate-semialdehyde decarboxylase